MDSEPGVRPNSLLYVGTRMGLREHGSKCYAWTGPDRLINTDRVLRMDVDGWHIQHTVQHAL